MATWAQSTLLLCFLGAVVVLAALTGIAALRNTLSLWSHRPTAKERSHFASSLGIGAVLAAPLALELGGAGALVWGVIGAIGGVVFAASAARFRGQQDKALAQLLHSIPGRPGMVCRPLYALCALILSALVCAVIGQQGQSLFFQAVPDRRVHDWVAMAAVLMPLALLLLIPAAKAKPWRARLASTALFGWLIVCALSLLIHHDQALSSLQSAISQAFDAAMFWQSEGEQRQRQIAALLSMSSAGLLASMWAGESCLGVDAIEPRSCGVDGPRPLVARILPPVLSAGLSMGLTGWMLLASGAPRQTRLDDPTLRKDPPAPADQSPAPAPQQRSVDALAQDLPHKAPLWMPLERPHVRRFAPSDDGQTIVLPTDSPLARSLEYPLLFRANPRGYQTGQLTPKGNGLFVQAPWRLLHEVKELRFRHDSEALANQPAWDSIVKVKVTRLGSDESPRGVVFTPIDPSINLQALSKSMRGPYVVLPDVSIVAQPQRMHSSDLSLGLHDAFIAETGHPENWFKPTLRDLVAGLGYRGPFLSGKEGEHPPFAMVAKEGIEGERGQQRALVYRTPSRGLHVGEVQLDGSLVTPPWEHLASAKTLIFRHRSDPHLDIRLPTQGRLEKGRLHFHSNNPAFNDLRSLAHHPDYEGPFLLAPDYHFLVELHDGDKFPDAPGAKYRGALEGELAKRTSLIPLHPDPEPIGGRGKLYRPHPAELAHTDAQGPFVPASPTNWVRRALDDGHSPLSGIGMLLATLLLGAGALKLARRLAFLLQTLLGPGAQWVAPILFLGAVFGGLHLSWATLAGALASSIALLFFVHLVAIALALPLLLVGKR